MKLKQTAALLAAFAMAAGSYADPVQVSVTGTATTTEMGYTAGGSYTFIWTVNDAYSGGSGDVFTSSLNQWYANTTTDPILLTTVSGDGLSGAYSRPAGSLGAPSNSLRGDSSRMFLGAENNDPISSSMGLTVDGTEVQEVTAYNLNIPGLDCSDTAFINPVSWLADYAGTHAVWYGGVRISDELGNQIFFTPTSATIEVIPEPSSVALIGLFGGGIVFVRRRFRI